MPEHVVLAGGSGFLGSAVARGLRAAGRSVIVLTRTPRVRADGVEEIAWVPAAPVRGDEPWVRRLDGAAGLINFTGRSIDCVPTPENRRAVVASRVDAARALGAALRTLSVPPPVWVQCSGAGWYGDRSEKWHDETSPAGADWLAEVCREWEGAFAAACPAAVRPVVLRLGVVLGREGGAFPALARLARLGLGGAAGSGRQGLCWIHVDDAVALFLGALGTPAMRGVYNACAPEAVPNAGFMRALRRAVRRPWSPPAPAFAVRLAARFVLRTNADLILGGQYVRPARLQAEGFAFRFGGLDAALADLAKRR